MDYDGATATVKVNEDGTVYVTSGEGEGGQGIYTVLSMVAAEELGVPLKDVAISRADTDATTFCLGAYGSRVTYVAGNAVRDAAAKAKEQLFEQASHLLEADTGELDSRDGRIFVKGSEARFVTVADAAKAHLFRRGGAPIIAFGSFDADSVMQDATRYGNESGGYNFGCQAVEVEVDPETGQVKVLEYASAADCGTVINPLGAEGQVDGALAQGIGYALTEGMSFEDGRPSEPNLSGYRIPSMRDMPKLNSAFADSYEPTGPFGAKGLGELGTDPTAAAISNAIFDAVGIRIRTLPITPEKVLKALQEKESG